MMLLALDEQRFIAQKLRPYQAEAVAAIREAWDSGDARPLAALATGAGKTTIIAELLVQSINPATQRALVIGHTEEIIWQLHDRITNQYEGKLDNYFGDFSAPGIGIVMAERDASDARIVVATRQSLHPKRLTELLEHGAFDVVIVDEAHHAYVTNSYGTIMQTLYQANKKIHVVGLTATPERDDKKALGSVFSSICYQWLIPQGIAQGYLVPVTRVKVLTRVNLNSVESNAGDYNQTKLVSALDAANWLDLSMEAYQNHIGGSKRSCLAFLPSVEMSRQFASLLNAQGIRTAHIDANTPKDERRAALTKYSTGELVTICNVGVLTEGFDAPQTSAIFLARPTRSQTLFTQILGRGIRPYPDKHDCLLVDMTVLDTKALEVGTLLGKMHTCKECKAEYYAGAKVCPRCGHPTPFAKPSKAKTDGEPVVEDVDTDEGYTGLELIFNYEALFEKAFAAWYNDTDGFFSCTLSFEEGALLIAPPIQDNLYRLVYVPKAKTKPVEVLNRNDDLTALMLDADAEVQRRAGHTAAKDAGWRGDPATQAQLEVLRKLRVKKLPAGLSKGAASQLITHTLAVKRVME